MNINTYFSKIFIVNLESRPDRWELMKKKLAKNNIENYERYQGIHIKSPSDNIYKKIVRTKSHKPMPGSVGFALTLLEILRKSMENDYDSILILQDDVVFHKDFTSLFEQNIKLIPSYWKLLYLGATQHNWYDKMEHQIKESVYYDAYNTCGAFAFAIQKSIFREIIDNINTMIAPVDDKILHNIQVKYSAPVFFPNIIAADLSDSNIREPRDQKIIGEMHFRWIITNYDFEKPKKLEEKNIQTNISVMPKIILDM